MKLIAILTLALTASNAAGEDLNMNFGSSQSTTVSWAQSGHYGWDNSLNMNHVQFFRATSGQVPACRNYPLPAHSKSNRK